EFVAWQAGIVREYARPEQFVTTCLHYPHVALDDDELTDHVDVTAGNPYYDMQDALTLPDPDNLDQDWKTRGVWAFYRGADWIFSSRQEPFLVTETNAGNIGTPWDNRPAYDGQWRQAAWAFVARGARMIEYWHWHTVHFGAETFWGGVLPHSGQPGRVYAELAQLGSEFAAAGAAVAGIVPDADVAMVYSLPNKWYMQKYPPLSTPDGQPDAGAYQRIFDAFYRGAFEAGLQVRMIHARKPAELDQHRVLVVPALHLADDATLDRLAAYAHAGGHLVIGPRTGYADQEARARRERAPGRLVEAAGVHYDEFSNLSQDLRVHAPEDSALALPEDASATLWVEGLTPVDADVLAEYDHHHFGRWPAITTRRHGAGRVTYVGTVPGRSLATALAAWLAPAPVSGWRNLPATVTATTGTSPDGSRVHVVHNWSGDRVQANAPVALTDLLDGAEVVAGGRIALGERDVRVFVERA
ncbi:MAG TPA: beta-galactosidase trimerization domain-containing protein, partial [Lentzea sp.]